MKRGADAAGLQAGGRPAPVEWTAFRRGRPEIKLEEDSDDERAPSFPTDPPSCWMAVNPAPAAARGTPNSVAGAGAIIDLSADDKCRRPRGPPDAESQRAASEAGEALRLRLASTDLGQVGEFTVDGSRHHEMARTSLWPLQGQSPQNLIRYACTAAQQRRESQQAAAHTVPAQTLMSSFPTKPLRRDNQDHPQRNIGARPQAVQPLPPHASLWMGQTQEAAPMNMVVFCWRACGLLSSLVLDAAIVVVLIQILMTILFRASKVRRETDCRANQNTTHSRLCPFRTGWDSGLGGIQD